MSTMLAVIAITVQIHIVSVIGYETIKVKAQKGETVVLKCSIPEGEATWLGPNVNNAGQRFDVYFLNNDKNPKLNQTKYSLQENEGGYDLIILNFMEENSGCYVCRFKNDGPFHETRYNISLVDNENKTTTTSYTARGFGKTSSIPTIVQTTNFQFPKNQQGNNEQSLVILLVMIPVVLLGGSITIVGVLARVKGISIGEMFRSFPLSGQRDTERHTATDEINEQDNTVENQLYQNSNVPPNENSLESEIPFLDRTVQEYIEPIIYVSDADLGVSEDTGATSNYRNTDESTAVKLYECTPGLHYAEISIETVESQQIKIHGIENRTIYTGIDHSLNRGVVQSDHNDNDSDDDFMYIKTLDLNSRYYENTCL